MAEFQFLRPWWLMALVPLCIFAFQRRRMSMHNSGWQQHIPQHLLPFLLDKGKQGAAQPWN